MITRRGFITWVLAVPVLNYLVPAVRLKPLSMDRHDKIRYIKNAWSKPLYIGDAVKLNDANKITLVTEMTDKIYGVVTSFDSESNEVHLAMPNEVFPVVDGPYPPIKILPGKGAGW